MKISKAARDLANELDLSICDAVVMELKAKLYSHAAKAIGSSDMTHKDISEMVGTSRARITRIANMGENSISLELLVKVIVAIENKLPFLMAA